ncbi:MAG TPA: hypothetical protein VEA78_03280 [Acidimicrobiales bacterium]|nr:hypothetical protein [Acidimicrobiales bacterium]
MPTFVVRVWIPDRPGALGAVASRIGAVRGDVVGIDILERGAGRAIDELYVELPDADLVDLLVNEIKAVDGVAVEDVRQADGVRDARLDALETATALMSCPSGGHLLTVLTEQAVTDFGADWAAVVDDTSSTLRAADGPAPEAAWLSAFVAGSSSSEAVAAGESGPDDLAWAALPTAGLHLVLGRSGRPLRSVERRQVAALARIADLRWGELPES